MQALNPGHLECLRLALKTLSQGLVANSGKLSPAKPEAVVSVVAKPVEPPKETPVVVAVDVPQMDERALGTLRTASCQYFPKISWHNLLQSQTAKIAETRDQFAIPSDSITRSAETYPAWLLKTNADFFAKLPWATGIPTQAKTDVSADLDESTIKPATASGADQISGSAFFQGLAWNGQVKSEIKVQPPQPDTLPLDTMSMGQLALQSAMKTAARPAQKADYFTLSSGHFFQAVFNPEKIPAKATQDQPATTIHWHKNNEFFPRLPW